MPDTSEFHCLTVEFNKVSQVGANVLYAAAGVVDKSPANTKTNKRTRGIVFTHIVFLHARVREACVGVKGREGSEQWGACVCAVECDATNCDQCRRPMQAYLVELSVWKRVECVSNWPRPTSCMHFLRGLR